MEQLRSRSKLGGVLGLKRGKVHGTKAKVLGLLAVGLLTLPILSEACSAKVCVQTYNFDLTGATLAPPFALIRISAGGGGALSDLSFSLYDQPNGVGLVRTVGDCCYVDGMLTYLTDPEALDGQFSITVRGLTWSSDWRYGPATGYVSLTEVSPNTGPVSPQLAPQVQLKLDSPSVTGCKSVTGVITILGPAPAGGQVVKLSLKQRSTSKTSYFRIPEGATSKSFLVMTAPVAAPEIANVGASVLGYTHWQDVTVRPMGLLSLSLTPTTVVGSNAVTGTVNLECKAGPGPVTVNLASSAPTVANPVAASVVVPQGLQKAPADVTTGPVQSKTYATITGTANGITKSKKLTVISAASVTPTSLKFGTQVVNTTSPALTAVLYNKGAVPYAILGITLTGTGAKYFAQSNNCQGNLAAGASCTIGVTFAPTVTGSKTASLVISTSAKSVPLKVYPSGTGVLPP